MYSHFVPQLVPSAGHHARTSLLSELSLTDGCFCESPIMGDCGFLINCSFFLVAAEVTLPLWACFGAMGTTESIGNDVEKLLWVVFL